LTACNTDEEGHFCLAPKIIYRGSIMGVSWKEYKGQKILYVDYRGLSEADGIKNLEAQAELMHTLQDPVFVLANYEGTFATSKFMNRLQILGKEVIERKTKKGALVGITGIKKVLLNAYNAFTGGNLKSFSNEESALDYLVP
jgi:hypothetical protein